MLGSNRDEAKEIFFTDECAIPNEVNRVENEPEVGLASQPLGGPAWRQKHVLIITREPIEDEHVLVTDTARRYPNKYVV